MTKKPTPAKEYKRLGKKEAERLVRELKEIKRTASMVSANFSLEIKEVTKLWRGSWIIYPLGKIIDRLKEIYQL